MNNQKFSITVGRHPLLPARASPAGNIEKVYKIYEFCASVVFHGLFSSGSYRDGWLCNGEVISEASYFIHGPPPFLVVDIVHRSETDSTNDEIVQIDLNFQDIQRVLRVDVSTWVVLTSVERRAQSEKIINLNPDDYPFPISY